MDRRGRQSSLPTSLIPHLYAAPRDSSTRTTLTSHSEDNTDQDTPLVLPPTPYIRPSSSYSFVADNRQLPPVLPANPYRSLEPSHIHRSVASAYGNHFPSSRSTATLLPSLPDLFPRNSFWREDEPGSSSLVHSGLRSIQNRRGSSQPTRVTELPRQDVRDYSSFPSQSAPHRSPVLPLPPLQYLSPIEPPFAFDTRDAYSYPQVASRSSTPNYFRQVSTPELELASHGSESLSVGVGSEGDDTHKDKRRRADSMDIDDNPKKSSRKTAVACNFCRGRKLRCNGAKPSCYNCTVRKFECEYVSTQRRRGPGKAPKGSRSRKGRSEHSGSSSNNIGDRLPTMVPDYDLSPDLRPYTSVISLDTFGFQPPDTSPQYPLDQHEPRRQYARTRTSRSRETSSTGDRSDAKDIQSGS